MNSVNTVTISLDYYNQLRDIQKAFESKKCKVLRCEWPNDTIEFYTDEDSIVEAEKYNQRLMRKNTELYIENRKLKSKLENKNKSFFKSLFKRN